MPTEIDEATLVVGLPKHGKSTILRKRALDWLRTYPTGLVLAHDLNEELVPDLTRYYESVEEWRDAYESALSAGRPFPRGASFGCSTEDLASLVMELGKKHNRAKNVRVPMLYALDENSESDTSGPTWQGVKDRRLWSRRRHFGVAPLLNAQVVRDINVKFWRQATVAYLFAQSQEQARDLEQKLSMKRGTLDVLVGAPKYRYLIWRQGVGLVSR